MLWSSGFYLLLYLTERSHIKIFPKNVMFELAITHYDIDKSNEINMCFKTYLF